MSHSEDKKAETEYLPAIIIPHMAFLPISLVFRFEAKTTAEHLAIYHAARGEITGQHEAKYFHSHIVLIPALLRPTIDKTVSTSKKTYSGAAVRAIIKKCKKLQDGIEYEAEICQKVMVEKLVNRDHMHFAAIEDMVSRDINSVETIATKKEIIAMLNRLMPFKCFRDEKSVQEMYNAPSPAAFADWIIHRFNHQLFKEDGEFFSNQELVRYFNEPSTEKKLRAVLDKLARRFKSEQVKAEINSKAKSAMGREQNKHMLRQRAVALQNELNEIQKKSQASLKDEDKSGGFAARVKAANMPQDVEKVANKQLERLRMIPPQSEEHTKTITYLDWLCDLPWGAKTGAGESVDIINARQILDDDHYGMKKVKQRIVEHLSILKLKPSKKPPILCFVGPPGVGKTSIGRSIARATGREFIRVSLGGVKDEAEIRGHRRTYIGALPGRIIQNIKKAGTKNAVFMLDEIDKLAHDFRGDPAAALLEVLDSEQNHAFSDHYLEVSYDLSPVFFICTANLTDPIPPALQDRLEIIHLSGYTRQEKYQIAKKFLIPKQMKEHGVEKKGVSITDSALYSLVDNYTKEAGVRNLEREIASVIRNRAVLIAEDKEFKPEIWASDLLRILGPQRFEIAGGVDIHEPGIVTGLAWTAYGGVTLIIESRKMKKIGDEADLKYTGRLGDVMKESIEVAWDIARKGIDLSFLKNITVHLHVPEGAVRKDGPSAGMAITVALKSLLSGRLVRRDLAMTGEITFRDGGTILPVGGIKEKLLAAHQAGYKYAFIPSQNEKDLFEVPEDVKRDMEIRLASNIDEVIEFALQ